MERALLEAARARGRAAARDRAAGALAAGDGWHPGIVGIVASRLVERHHRPVVVLGVADGIAKGSARSIRGFDLGAAVIAARQRACCSMAAGTAWRPG